MSETRTYAPILINREEYSTHGLERFHDFHTKVLILKTLDSPLHLGLSVIVDDDPELISVFE